MKISGCPNLKIKFNLFILPTGQLAESAERALPGISSLEDDFVRYYKLSTKH